MEGLGEFGIAGAFITALISTIIWGAKKFAEVGANFAETVEKQSDKFLSETQRLQDRHHEERSEWQRRDDEKFKQVVADLGGALRKYNRKQNDDD